MSQTLLVGILAVSSVLAGDPKNMSADGPKGFAWESPVPDDCPFPKSTSLTGIFFTSRHSDYRCGDTWYPCWASDGNLYSPWTDGKTDGVGCSSDGGAGARTGHAVMIGDDPLRLKIHNNSPPKQASALPYKGRYPAGSLVYNGIWYYGTYCLGPDGTYSHGGFDWNWPNLGPIPGFQISRDYGKTWEPSPLTPEKPLFPEPHQFLGPVKMGAPHFVDFGKDMVHSPDGKAYLLGIGAEEDDPKPRPCIKPGKPGEVFQIVKGCTSDFAHANLSWITADQVYLARVKPSPETINDLKAWEFFAGHDGAGQPIWTDRFNRIKPLIEWNNHMGCVTATYVPGLKKYLMCVTDGWPTVAKMTSYILEADAITGPWRIVSYMKDFGEQGYFLNFPSKFISPDGRTLWLCYSANFSPGWNDVKLDFNPPGGRYGLCLHEVKLLTPEERPPECDPATHSLEEQIAFQKKQIAELIEKYPDVFYLWNDALDPKIMPADETQAFIRGLRVDRVPIVVYDPRAPCESRGLVNRDLVLNVDLGPTLMDLAGVPIPSHAQGRSLKPLLSRGTPAWRSEIFCAELWDHPEIPRSECVRTERWKYIQYHRHPEYVELFALAADPDEKMNLAEDPGHARVLAKLREHCSRTIKELLDDQTRTKDPETLESVPAKAAQSSSERRLISHEASPKRHFSRRFGC